MHCARKKERLCVPSSPEKAESLGLGQKLGKHQVPCFVKLYTPEL